MKHAYISPQSKLLMVEAAGILALSTYDEHNDGNFEEITRRKGIWDFTDDDTPFRGGTQE